VRGTIAAVGRSPAWGQLPKEDQYPGAQGATCDTRPHRRLATPGWAPSPSCWHQNVGKMQHKGHRGPLERKAAVTPKADTNARKEFVREYRKTHDHRKISRYAARRSGRDSRSKGKSNDIATSLSDASHSEHTAAQTGPKPVKLALNLIN